MESIYALIRKRARQIVAQYPRPVFYAEHREAQIMSRTLFDEDAFIAQIKKFVTRTVEHDFGHGLEHSFKVAVDAGALIFVEAPYLDAAPEQIRRLALLAQVSGLLHDLKRKLAHHALKGAAFSRHVLNDAPLNSEEKATIFEAIKNHEAFRSHSAKQPAGRTPVSDCLYDADKFRWGPDNFADTVWDMVAFSQTPISRFIEVYPMGMEMLARIKDTFRSETGRRYGPEFIDLGLMIGEELYEVIMNEFAPRLCHLGI